MGLTITQPSLPGICFLRRTWQFYIPIIGPLPRKLFISRGNVFPGFEMSHWLNIPILWLLISLVMERRICFKIKTVHSKMWEQKQVITQLSSSSLLRWWFTSSIERHFWKPILLVSGKLYKRWMILSPIWSPIPLLVLSTRSMSLCCHLSSFIAGIYCMSIGSRYINLWAQTHPICESYF